MKKAKGMLSFLLVIMLLLGSISVLCVPAKAQTGNNNNDVRYTKKIVSVLFDDSGSMNDQQRIDYALYSIQMLMSLLSENDTLVLTPMNYGGAEVVNLQAPDRNAELRRVMNTTFLSKSPSGGTPGSSIGTAVNELKKQGLKTKDELTQGETNTEYWLVVLTDGAFDNEEDPTKLEAKFVKYIDDYPSLQTIYLGFSAGAVDLTGSSLTTKYPFTPFCAANVNDIIQAMQDVANLMSGRFTLPADAYAINGSTITVDLDRYEYALSSVSVLAQNCGAEITKATYQSNAVDVSLPCIIKPTTKLNILDGYTGVVKGDPYMSGGTLVLEFDAPVSTVSLMAEPALFITPYIEHNDGSQYQRVDIQYVNANLKAGDKIRIGYEVYERANGNAVDINKLFGKAETKVTYANNSYACGEDFELVLGTNEINVQVSVMDGKYTMYQSLTCIVEADPSHYRIEADFDEALDSATRKTRAVYTVYVNNKPLTASELEAYTVEAKLTAADGSEIKLDVVKGSDGKIQTSAPVTEGAYGVYTEYIKVTSEKGVSREHTHEIKYYPASFTVNLLSGGGFSINESQLANGQAEEVKFELVVDGKPFDFNNSMAAFELLFDGANVSSYASIDGNTLSYTPNSNDTGKGVLDIGEKVVSLKVYLKDNPSISATAEARFNLTPSVYVIEMLDGGNQSIRRFDTENNTAELQFRITRDGQALNYTEVKSLYDNKTLVIADESGYFEEKWWIPCSWQIAVNDVDGAGVVMIQAFGPDGFLKTYPAMTMGKDSLPVKITFRDASSTAAFEIPSDSWWSYTWRILLLIAVLIWIAYTIVWLVYVIKVVNNGELMLPSGSFVIINCGGDDNITGNIDSYNSLNITTWDRWKFALLLYVRFSFDPFVLFPAQKAFELEDGIITLAYVDGYPKFVFGGTIKELPLNEDSNSEDEDFIEYKKMFNEVANISHSSECDDITIRPIAASRVRDFHEDLSDEGKLYTDSQSTSANSRFYGVYANDGQRLMRVIKFVFKV